MVTVRRAGGGGARMQGAADAGRGGADSGEREKMTWGFKELNDPISIPLFPVVGAALAWHLLVFLGAGLRKRLT
jgi:hypothetical protein